MTRGQHLASNPFYATAEQRITLARRRFFEEGVRPSGMVGEAVLQSWARCLREHPDPSRPAVFEPVTASRVHSVLRQNRQLIEAADDGLAQLRITLAGTPVTAMLADAQGVIIGSSFTQARSHERLMPVATRVGVNLSEQAVGTTAPGLTARTSRPVVVSGAEHYFGNAQVMHCAAAPIHDVRGRLAGVLDLSSEGAPFGFDAAAVVGHYAAEIENRLLCAQSGEHLVLRLQLSPGLLDTPMAGLVGVTGDGRLDWANAAASRLLGLTPPPERHATATVESHLGLTLATLLGLGTAPDPQPLHLPNGLTVWLRGEWRSRDGHRGLHAAPSPTASNVAPATPSRPETAATPTSLRETEHQAIARALQASDGNVARAARTLGISRGRIYRHLQQARETDTARPAPAGPTPTA